MPLFMLSRLRIKQHSLQPMRKYIARKTVDYTKRCKEENAIESKTNQRVKHMLGRDYVSPQPCPQPRLLQLSRLGTRSAPWHLPPNLYAVHKTTQPNTADYQHKLKLNQKRQDEKALLKESRKKRKLSNWKFYDKNATWERHDRHKGIFLSNPRNRRATVRSMVTSSSGCYRDPNDPGPSHYFPRKHLPQSVGHSAVNQKHNPHVFLPHLTVPQKANATHFKHVSFAPGPGRYETRYRGGCPCSRRLTYMPGLQLLIEDEKRKKFRRLPYTKIKARKYCSPDWRHVAGGGFRYLFRKPRMRPRSKSPKGPKDVKKTGLHLQLYPDARYISMITDPMRSVFSWVEDSLPHRPPRIEFNCSQKRIIRRQLDNTKKVAFNSGEERFTDILGRAPNLTKSQQEKIKQRLPLNRQLRDHPVMRVQPAEIKSRLYEQRKFRSEGFDINLRKRDFKFLPLPKPKILVYDEDIKAQSWKPLYNSEIDPTQFFKDDGQGRDPQNAGFTPFSSNWSARVEEDRSQVDLSATA